jgi:uncharacterized protein
VRTDLNAPLGLDRKPAQRQPRLIAMRLSAGLLGAVLTLFMVWALLGNDPLGGEPTAVVNAGLIASSRDAAPAKPGAGGEASPSNATSRTLNSRGGPPGKETAADRPPGQGAPDDKAADAASRGLPSERAGAGEQIVTIIDGKSGARQEVKIPASSVTPQADDPIIEMTRNGPIPRIGADGARASAAYAQPVAVRSEWPQLAIVITGLGVSASNTDQAINKLPAPVTLAFAPYGGDLAKAAAKARSLGHELLLQVPMEPFDYPDNDPGPQTLVTSLPPEQNIERLQWAMSRFRGYVGIANQMGARFTASEMSFTPILREISKRGLLYVDDGSSPRSLAGQIAGGNSLPFAKANLSLDAVPSAGEIDRALVRLEATARENGVAVGIATALPVSIDRISRWAKTAESRGFALVPITAAAARPKSI